ncbi:MAG: HEPN domain-containing protein [Cytophagales bacterium]|nr:HEPN domain-containing protein [Cytophagales bacterium]
MDKKQLVDEWFFIANSDLESAIFLKNMHPAPLEIICFHCQQCAEKYLKGYLVHNEIKIKKTHDLIRINQKCNNINIDFKKIQKECIRLTKYGADIRYPTHLDITMPDMELAIKDATKIKEFVLKKIKTKI